MQKADVTMLGLWMFNTFIYLGFVYEIVKYCENNGF